MTTSLASIKQSFEIRFTNHFDAGSAFCFPCDPQGHVDMDALSERARENYMFARAMVGRDYSPPHIHHPATA